MKELKFYYGRDFSWWHYAILLLCLITMPTILVREWKNPGVHIVPIYLYIAILALFVIFITYTFISAYQKNKEKKVALKLTEEHMAYVGGNQIIPWDKIYNLTFKEGKIKIIFKDDDIEPVAISMDKVRGDSFYNYNLIYDYMEVVEKINS